MDVHRTAGCRGREIAGTKLPDRVRHMQTLRKAKSAGHFTSPSVSANATVGVQKRICTSMDVREPLRSIQHRHPSSLSRFIHPFCLSYARRHSLWPKHFQCPAQLNWRIVVSASANTRAVTCSPACRACGSIQRRDAADSACAPVRYSLQHRDAFGPIFVQDSSPPVCLARSVSFEPALTRGAESFRSRWCSKIREVGQFRCRVR